MLKERMNPNEICLRKISGLICLISGILIIFTKLIYYVVTGDMIPYSGRGQFLVGTGAALLGLTSFDGLLTKKS